MEITRRTFMTQMGAAGAAVAWIGATGAAVASLRAGDREGAEREAADLYERAGLRYRLYDITDYGIRGDGVTDNSDAFEEMFARTYAEAGQVKCYFFPAGRYLISRQLVLLRPPEGSKRTYGNYASQWIGQGPMLSQLILAPGAEGFADPEHPRLALNYADDGETLGSHYLGLAVLADTEGRNPGSIAASIGMHGGVAADLMFQGGHTCYQSRGVGFWTCENITCMGGRIGISMCGGHSFQNVRCMGFTKTGIQVFSQIGSHTLSLANVHTRGSGPAVSTGYCGFSIMGGRFEADPESDAAAVYVHPRNWKGVTLHNIQVKGYKEIVGDTVPAPPSRHGALTLYAGNGVWG